MLSVFSVIGGFFAKLWGSLVQQLSILVGVAYGSAKSKQLTAERALERVEKARRARNEVEHNHKAARRIRNKYRRN